MNNPLHILNGDSTLALMNKARIPGSKAVWRDVLAEGPVTHDFASHVFWEIRTRFMSDFFGVIPVDFKAKCIDEFDKIRNFAQYSEVVLWFEYDLFCQINMLGILHFLATRVGSDTKISLICVGIEMNADRLIGLGEIPPEQYPALLENRVELNQEDLNYASKIFVAYCNDPQNINLEIQEHAKFPYLKGAFGAHLKRFPFKTTGLNEIELTMLNIINSGATIARQVVGEILKWQRDTYYGFGDEQYSIYLERLSSLVDENFNFTEKGIEVIKRKTSAKGLIDRAYQLGGAHVSDFEWDENLGVLISI